MMTKQQRFASLYITLVCKRFKQEIMDEVGQEFLVTKTIQELETVKTDNVLFVGMYLTSDDKVKLILC